MSPLMPASYRSLSEDQVRARVEGRVQHLVLDLSFQREPVPRSRLLEISPRVAHHYHGRTEKTLARDLNELLRMDLVLRRRQGYVANRGVVFAFLPARRARQQPSQDE